MRRHGLHPYRASAVTEHPFDPSWGYQPIGLFAPTARFGDPARALRASSTARTARARRHPRLGAGAFPHRRARPRALRRHGALRACRPAQGFHPDWNTAIYNFGRRRCAFLVNNALFWLERFHVDGLRVDAVSSMLYLDYSRKEGEWMPNEHGGRENLEAVAFLQRVNEAYGAASRVVMIAEESTSWPGVSRRPRGRARLRLQVEHGLHARHAALHGASPSTAAPPQRPDLRPALRLLGEFRAAAQP
jgi:1,4-alpha-glucan branching enzyme